MRIVHIPVHGLISAGLTSLEYNLELGQSQSWREKKKKKNIHLIDAIERNHECT